MLSTIKNPLCNNKSTMIRFSKYPEITSKSWFLNFGLKIHTHTAKIQEKKDSYRKSWFINDYELICALKVEGNRNFWPFSAFFAHFSALKVSWHQKVPICANFWTLACFGTWFSMYLTQNFAWEQKGTKSGPKNVKFWSNPRGNIFIK